MQASEAKEATISRLLNKTTSTRMKTEERRQQRHRREVAGPKISHISTSAGMVVALSPGVPFPVAMTPPWWVV